MTLKQQLIEEMKSAMRAREALRLGVIRFLLSEIKNYEIDHGEQDDAGVISIVARQIKQIKESISEYEKGGRSDLVEEERQKLAVLETYLPKQLSDEEIESIVQEVIAANPGLAMGPLVGQVMSRVKGQADGGRVSAVVKKLLSV